MLFRAGLRSSIATLFAALIFVLPYNSFAEEQKQDVGQDVKQGEAQQESKKGTRQDESIIDKVKDVIGLQEAYAMPVVPAPSIPIQTYDTKKFICYSNQPVISRFFEKEPTRDDLEKILIYRAYYFVDDKKEQVEERLMEGINKSEFKDKIGIDKISTKIREDNLIFQIRFKEKKKKQGFLVIKKNYEDEEIEIKYTIKF